MANQWFRVWHDMPNDPKWRTIARTSGQSIPVVQSVFLQLLLSASQNVTRGHADVTLEDIASALDVTEEAVEAVIQAMQGRVLDGMAISGWEKRQPKREDSGDPEGRAKSAAQRKREQRERERLAAENKDVTQCHDESRDVTLDKDKDTDKEKEKTLTGKPVESASADPCPHQAIVDLYHKTLPELAGIRDITDKRKKALRARWRSQKRFQNLDFWRQYFELVSESDFLMGRIPGKSWQADFDFLIKSDKFQKIIEGGYQGGGQ